MLITKVFKAGEVLQVSSATHRLGVKFLDWRITRLRGVSSEDLVGAGLYGVCYQDKLVYVGKYLGTRGNPFAGNIVSNRWWAHFASLTMRGHRISVPRMTLAKLLNDPPTPLNPKLRNLLADVPPGITRDAGCVASLNRILFASQHWRRFGSSKPSAALDDFSFVYVRIDKGATRKSKIQLRNKITEAENDVINKLCPMANSEVEWGMANVQVSCKEATAVITKILTKYAR